MRTIFQKKGQKGQNIWKFGQKCAKSESVLKKGSLMRATIACMKQLEYALNTHTQINVCCVHIYYGEKKCGFLIIFVIEKIKTCSADVSRKLVFKLKQASTYSGF